jgi:diguanylate cyclase (GGDEF)-like protein
MGQYVMQSENFESAPEIHSKNRKGSAQRDVLAGGIIIAAILMFIGTGSRVMTQFVDAVSGIGGGPDQVLSITLILNIALLLFAWRRYADLNREVAERSEAEKRARTLALTDPLTGFLNRRSISEQGSVLLDQYGRRGKSVALMMLDLDHFKNVNDVHGHAIGDAVLRVAAERIKSVMPPSALCARLGGDEFVVIVPFDPENQDVVTRIAEKLVGALAQPIRAETVHVTISTSIGITRAEPGTETMETLMRHSDIAMYAAKKQGRNRYVWFDASMERELHARNRVEMGIRDGIPKGEFVPYFEQQIDLATGRLQGFEVLARWESPTHGTVSPTVFIPIAEECGLIADLSMSVMRQAMLSGKNWDPSLTLSVNISPAQLKDPWLAQKIVKLLVETGYPANRLEIEITESSLFDNLSLAQSIVGSLKNQGIRLALDDFGTGYSSLAHLRALPFDRIKIDRSFVSSMTSSNDSAAIVGAITKLGESLGMPVTAEGIEDEEIEARLVELGCAKGQGWYFGKPINAKQTEILLAERNLLPEQAEKLQRKHIGFIENPEAPSVESYINNVGDTSGESAGVSPASRRKRAVS